MYSKPAVGLLSLVGRRGGGQNIALPLSYTRNHLAKRVIRFELTTDVIQPAVAATKAPLPNKDSQRRIWFRLRFGCSPDRQLAAQDQKPNEDLPRDVLHVTGDVLPTGSWAKDAGGSRTHFDRVAAGRLAIWLQRQVSSSGVEPDPRPSQGRVRSATPRGCNRKRADGWIRTSMRRFTGPLPFSIEPHRHTAGAQGFEPCRAALETACSPRSTLLCQGVRGESNPPPRPS